jgi:hypothetical protein
MIYTKYMTEIARRKENLVAKSVSQRAALVAEFGGWQKPIDVIDHGIAAARFLKSHPLPVATAMVVVAVLGRRKLLRWAGQGLVVWRAWRTVRELVAELNTAPRQGHAGRISAHRSSV